MDKFGPDDVSPQGLARLLDLHLPVSWSAVDAAAALRHQLAAPLIPELERLPSLEATLQHHLKNQVPHPDDRNKTFLDHLLSPSPDLATLEMIKTFARRVDEDEANPLRGVPARILYFAAIAAALTGCNARITQSNEDSLRDGFKWCMGVEGAEPLNELFAKAGQSLNRA